MLKNFNYSKLDNTINLSISLNLEDKLDICFVDLHNIIQNDLGYEVFKAIEDIAEICDIKRVTKCGASQYSFYYDDCANYKYRNYSLDELKNSYEIVLNEQDKNNIKYFVQDIKNEYIENSRNDYILKSCNLSIDEIICNIFTRDKYHSEDDEFYSEVESYIAMLIADKYYRYFWQENLENNLNEILENYSDDELKDIIEYIIYEEEQ
ncbi:MAG: hypothetical protein IJ414_01205 [Campylobacter sp.]|uniref:hypothetical protein n=1 Tax=Campylobacter sp. TaxID=205 RepID=UPI00259C6A42|nr:hypothetical protein [Campylobacter sp.]MBQ8608747.1 hypothetical protein [Campylobacter sp.]